MTMKSALEGALSRPAAGRVTPTVHGAHKTRFEYIPVEEIDVVKQVRTAFDPARLDELAASIKANGVINPLLVRVVAGRFQLVAGERRLRASKVAGLQVVPCLVADMGDARALEAQLVENTHRAGLNAADEAFGVRALHEKLGLSLAVTADRLGKSDAYVAQMISITELPRRAVEALRSGILGKASAYELSKVAEPAARAQLIARLLPEKKKGSPVRVSVSRVRAEVRRLREKGKVAEARARTPQGTGRAQVLKFWRHFLLKFTEKEFTYFVELCKGRSEAGVMAEAVAAVVAGRGK